jgi:non-heme chloroperoxidase
MNPAVSDYRVSGVHVRCALPASGNGRPPVIMVHGGLHGSWNWHVYAGVLSERGWACHALDWYGHHQSDPLPTGDFVKRGIADVTEEIGLVADHLGQRPVLMGHSMGGLACQKFASMHPVAGLVLLAPVLPAVIGNVKADMAIDPTVPWGPPTFELAQKLFFTGVPDEDAHRYYGLLNPESPRCVAEATGEASVNVDLDDIDSPVCVLVGEHDLLTPADRVQQLAERLGADFCCYPARSHSLLIDGEAKATAQWITTWLDAQVSA